MGMNTAVGFAFVVLSLVGCCLCSPAGHRQHHWQPERAQHRHYHHGLLANPAPHTRSPAFTKVDDVLHLLNEARHLEDDEGWFDDVLNAIGTITPDFLVANKEKPLPLDGELPLLTVSCADCPSALRHLSISMMQQLLQGNFIPKVLPNEVGISMMRNVKVVNSVTVYSEPIESLGFAAAYHNLYKSTGLEMPRHYFMVVSSSSRGGESNTNFHRVERDGFGIHVTDITTLVPASDPKNESGEDEAQMQLKPNTLKVKTWTSNLSETLFGESIAIALEEVARQAYNTMTNNCQHTLVNIISDLARKGKIHSEDVARELVIQDPKAVATIFAALGKACQACP